MEADDGVEGEQADKSLSTHMPRRAKRSKREERPPAARQALAVQPVAADPTRGAPLTALPADVWMRVVRAIEEGGECYCSWPLVPAAVALPYLRHALAAVSSLIIQDSCRCQHSGVSASQRIRSQAWLVKQTPELSDLVLKVEVSPPPLFCSFVRSVLLPCLSSLTSLTLYLSRSLPLPPRLLYSVSQAPCLKSLELHHGIGQDSREEMARHGCNDPVLVAGMWELISVMEENDSGGTSTERPFPALRTLHLFLCTCSPLVLRFISCLAPRLRSFDFGTTTNQFALQEGGEGMEGRGARGGRIDGQRAFPLHLPLATFVSIGGLACSISLSAPLLSSLSFDWASRRSRLLLLPTCPTHLPALYLRPHPSYPWAFHAPHLTSIDNLRTNLLPAQVADMPQGVVSTVRALHWEIRLPPYLDMRAWSSLRCLCAQSWYPVSLAVLRTGVEWPCGLEALFLDSIDGDVVRMLTGETGGGEGVGGLERSGGEGSSRRGNEAGMALGCDSVVEEGGYVRAEKQSTVKTDGKAVKVGKTIGCKSLGRFEGWECREAGMYVWEAGKGTRRKAGSCPAEGMGNAMDGMDNFCKAAGIATYRSDQLDS